MNILETLVQLRDDLKTWVINNLSALNDKIEEKTIPIDSELSATSTNPVQNKVINAEIDALNSLIGNTDVETQIKTAIESQELFSGDYNDLTNAPNISEDNSDNVVIADESGNIIFKVDAEGTHTTDVKINGMSLGAKISEWDAKSGFSGDYNDLTNAPNIVEDGSQDLVIADESGNIIFKVDEAGAHTTILDAQSVTINNQSVTDIMDAKVAALVNSAPETLDTLSELAGAMENNSDAIEALETIATSKAAQSDLDVTNANVAALQGLVGDTAVDKQIEAHEKNTLHFSGDYSDLTNAPNIEENDDGDMVVTDDNGNIIFKVDASGAHSTSLTLNGKDVVEMINEHQSVVDSEMSETSTNPVQNKVVYEQIQHLQDLIDDIDPVVQQTQIQIITWESDD